MKVRVFVPVAGKAEAYDCSDFQFEAMPVEGQFVRLFTPEPTDLPIERVGFIQEGYTFVAAIWLARPPLDAWPLRTEAAAEIDLPPEIEDLIKPRAKARRPDA
jgi:hypothetical protein